MNILVINHYFDQDIDAFLCAGAQHSFWPISHRYFTLIAERAFEKPVFTGLEAYYRPEYSEQRKRYADRVRAKLQELYAVFPFDIILSPSDTFFWIRAVIDAAHELGVPFVVLQKEATVTEAVMGEPARELGRLFPFVGDRMLVSSDFHARFWINAGTRPDIVDVTGQPRFDFYQQPGRWKTWSQLGFRLQPGRRNVLFLTYDSHAYLPMWVRTGLTPWLQMRQETEEVLLKLAREGSYNVLIKPHPQPAEDQTEHLRALAASNPHVHAISGDADTRHLIVNSDIVVSFQSTVVFEAMAAGKDTIYTYWTRPVIEAGDSMTPFHRMDDALRIAHSPDELTQIIQGLGGDHPPDLAVERARHRVFEQYLGPLDGRATERCLSQMAETVELFENNCSVSARALRGAISKNAAVHCRRALPASLVSVNLWAFVETVLLPIYPVWAMFRRFLWWKRSPPTPRAVYEQYVKERRMVAGEWLRRCYEASTGE